ncbi:hypothetical protein BD311DRAFT_758842 [Dichomitus squalens]|uniref:Uncharacterized protein n=1 Tax=Dichomitus squalens TaxID=114155 RepID=A0A4V2K0A4_9APHY|nr:hypothetical protein BD311DRAFT_758842 [Dichomitus squalens]
MSHCCQSQRAEAALFFGVDIKAGETTKPQMTNSPSTETLKSRRLKCRAWSRSTATWRGVRICLLGQVPQNRHTCL